jgi:large subunit ribosomal protein L30e
MSVAKLREALRTQQLIYGTRQTLRNLKRGKTKVIFLSQDCNPATKDTISYYSTLRKVQIIQIEQGGREIAQLCKKNFPVSVLSY